MRYEAAGYPGLDVVPDSITKRGLALLRDAMPAYRACWWRDHDQRNRAWIEAVVPRLRRHEDSIKVRLAAIYQSRWKAPYPVDVVSFGSFTGANTVVDPDHVMISSRDSSYRGDAALEMLFHEVSHTMIGRDDDLIAHALRDSTVLPRGRTAPRDLAHVILFYTVGRVTQDRLRETGVSDYRPYMYGRLFDQVWPQYRAPLERHWEAYMNGRITAAAAIRQIVREMQPR
jgi:hypothetical protein